MSRRVGAFWRGAGASAVLRADCATLCSVASKSNGEAPVRT